MLFIINAIKIIFVLGFLVLIHECGHFFAARACKVKVNAFAVGFGPTIWKKKKKDTEYALRLIPLGGYVNMEGEEQRSSSEGSFSEAKIWKRIIIILAGATVNIIFALIAYFILLLFIGQYPSTTINSINTEYDNGVEVLQIGDEIVEVNNKNIIIRNDLERELKKAKGNQAEVKVNRNGEFLTFNITPIELNGQYYLGVVLDKTEYNFSKKVYFSFRETGNFIISIGDNLKMLFTGKVGADQLMGPIGIGEMVSKTSGIMQFAELLALISLSLGVTNLLPFPPLDGGKIVILVIEGVRRKPMKENIEITIQLIGFALLIALAIYASYNDILRIF